MIVEYQQTRTHKVQNETLNGINILAFLTHSSTNTAIAETDFGTGDFDPSAINVDVKLKRNLQTFDICNTNLGVLAAYNTLIKNGALWRKGITNNQPSGVVKHTVSRMCFIYFGGHINVNGSDELLITVTITKSAFGSNIDASRSHLQVEVNQSIGVEVGIPRFNNYAIQAGQSEDNVNIGDNCLRLAMISFEKDPSNTIFTSASLSSDRLDWTKNEDELTLQHFDNFPYNSADKLINDLANNIHPLYYPHSRLVHDKDEIDRAKIKFTMQSANINASKNYICYTTYVTSHDILQRAMKMKAKHNQKDADKVPLSLNA